MQTFIGKVVSAKSPQTVAVEFAYFQKHPKYQKIMKRTTRLLAHNEIADVSEGDTVKIIKSRPYSRVKHFKVVEIVSKSVRQAKTEEVTEIKKPVKEEKKKITTVKKTKKA